MSGVSKEGSECSCCVVELRAQPELPAMHGMGWDGIGWNRMG